MNFRKNATLIGGAIFVIAASIFVETMEQKPLPIEIANTLELRQALFVCRSMPPPGSSAFDSPGPGDTSSLLTTSSIVTDLLSPMADKKFADQADHLTAATAAISVNARHLVPLFLAQAGSNEFGTVEPGTMVMLRWAFDPEFIPGVLELEKLRALDMPEWVTDMAVSTIMRPVIPDLPEQHRRLTRWNRTTVISGLVMSCGIGLLIWGLVAWFRWRKRQFAEIVRGRDPSVLTENPLTGLFSTYIWFTAFFLAVNLLMPEWLQFFGLGMASQSLLTYLITGIGGLVIASTSGRTETERNWRQVLGIKTTVPQPPAPFKRNGALHSGIRGWAMIWPLIIMAAFIGSLFGNTANGLDNPVSFFLATELGVTDRIILIFSAVILAPLFEEPLFRGFFYRRFRRILSPYGAAAASGFIFAAAHFSSSGFLSIWAIGFTLGLTYESSGRLRSSMLAHALWNLGTSVGILALYG